ncbi:LysM peptidoglycan-binding domain-containing protein [Heyndrickxia sporothermodurans]
MTTDPYRDQVEKLRKRIDKVSSENSKGITDAENSSSLPSRSELHRSKRKKKKKKIKFPLLRVLLIFFILLPFVSLFIYSEYFNKTFLSLPKEKATGEQISFETSTSGNEDSEKVVSKKKENEKDPLVKEEKVEKKTVNTKKKKEKGSTPKKEEPKKEKVENKGSVNESTTSNSTTNKSTTNNSTTNEDNSSRQQKVIYHTVQPKETLFSIAMKYYHSQAGIDKIKQFNNITNDGIMVGQVLQIHLP